MEAVNASSHTVPAYGVVEITGSEASGDAQRLTVTRPQSDGATQVAVNGPLEIPPGNEGVVTLESPVFALYSGIDTPVNGQRWGAAADSFSLAKDLNGFIVTGGETAGRVQVIRAPAGDRFWQFTLTEDMNATEANQAAATKLDASGLPTGDTINVQDATPNQMWAPLTAGSSGWCFEREGDYHIIQAECAADGGSFFNEFIFRMNFRV